MLVQKDGLVDALEYLNQNPRLSVDTETTGLRHSDRAFSVQFANAERSYYFDKRVLGEDFHKIHGLFHKERTWYAQNAKFDLRQLHWEGWHPKGPVLDLEVLVRLTRNDVHTTKLEAVAKSHGMEKLKIVDDYITEHKLWTRVPSKYWPSKIYENQHYDKVPLEIMAQYAPHDTRITYDLCEMILPRLDPKSMDVLANETALTPVCLDMELGGALVDQEYALRMLKLESGLILEAQNEFRLVTGKSYDTSKQFLIEIFEAAGETIPRTAKGNPSLTDDVLESFTSPAAQVIQRIRHYEKRISTYYSSFLDLPDSQGRIHPDMRQAGTKTGRFSYRDPNLQNIPKEDDPDDLIKENLIRRCFIPEKDHVLVSMDYSQQEYRLMLAYADQRDLVAKVMGGMDLHEATAQLVGITRKLAKTLNFAILYGAGDDKLAWMLGITPIEARLLRQRYFAALPMIMHFINNVKNTVASRGFVYNWMGRKLHLPGNLKAAAYAVPNHLIQGGGADVCKKAMVQVAPEIKGTGIRMQKQVHDQLVFQWPKDQLDKIPRVREIMEDVFPEKNGMRMKVDVAWSTKSFAEADMTKGLPDGIRL